MMCVRLQLFEASRGFAAAAISLTALSLRVERLCSVCLEPRPQYEWTKKRAGHDLEKSTTVSKCDSFSPSLFSGLLGPSDHFLVHRLLSVNKVIPSAAINTHHAQ